MIPKIAIHGRENQPNLVIEYLENLGGNNITNWSGDDIKGFYWIDELKRIRCTDNIPEGYQYKEDWFEKENKSTETKYLLVKWPESQYFIGIEGCYHIHPMEDIELDQVMFVPEEIYYKVISDGENSNTRTSD